MHSLITGSIVLFNTNLSNIIPIIDNFLCQPENRILFIIDNSPKCLFVDFKWKSSVKYIFNGKNVGYGAGHNVAIKKAIRMNSCYHFIFNPDIIFEDQIIDKLVAYIDDEKQIGSVMPKILYPDGRTQYLCKLLATPFDLIGRRFLPFQNLIEKRNNKYELRFTGYNKQMQVPSLSGCFMLLRTEVLKQVGGFDERFFMYCEDFDLCRRIGQVSKTVFYPEVSVIHNYEKGSYKNYKLLKYHIISAIKYFNKWGWFFDKERKQINEKTLTRLGYYITN